MPLTEFSLPFLRGLVTWRVLDLLIAGIMATLAISLIRSALA